MWDICRALLRGRVLHVLFFDAGRFFRWQGSHVQKALSRKARAQRKGRNAPRLGASAYKAAGWTALLTARGRA